MASPLEPHTAHSHATRSSTAPTKRPRETTSRDSENAPPNRPQGTRHRRVETTTPPPPILVPLEVRCQYKGKMCRNERTFKDDGERHTLCELHRQRANANQRRWQQKHQHKVRRRRAAAARANAEALPYSVQSDGLATPLLAMEEKEEDDWISPLFDHLIAKMETGVSATVSESETTRSRRHADKPN